MARASEATSRKSIWDKLLCSDIFGTDSIRIEIGEGMQSKEKLLKRIDELTYDLGLLTSKLNSIDILTDYIYLEEEYERIKSNRFIVNGRVRVFKNANGGREPTETELKEIIKGYIVDRCRRQFKPEELANLEETKANLKHKKRTVASTISETETILEVQEHIKDSEPIATRNNFAIAQSRILLFLYGFRKELLETLAVKAGPTDNDILIKKILEDPYYDLIKDKFITLVDIRSIKSFIYNLCDLLKTIPLSDFAINAKYAMLENMFKSEDLLLLGGGSTNIYNLYYSKSYY